jgi:polyhydroxybutyrate depolymerase
VAVVAALAGVAAPVGASQPGGTSLPRASLAATPVGCGVAFRPGSAALAFYGAGRPRRVLIVHIPTGYTGNTKVPLVVNLHGSGSTAVLQELFSGMNAEADAAGFIVAYPQALIPSGSGYDWNVPGVPLRSGARPPKSLPNDLAFLSRVVVGLEGRYCVNPARVYVTGFSGGARMASQLACDDSNIFAAVAPVSGLRSPTPCPTVRAVPILAFHGTADPIDPYGGHGQSYWTYSVPQAARLWAAADGCSNSPRVSYPAAGVTLTQYGRCQNHAAVGLYTIGGEGHEWPGGPSLAKRVTRALGPQSSAVDANSAMWAFFSAHKL